jgi:hypothetical protein
MIIVILGILAATAVIKYIDIQSEAEEAAIRGIYGHMASAYGVSIASLRRSPTVAEVNANLGGEPGDLCVNGANPCPSGNTIQFVENSNTIRGKNRRGVFNVTTTGGAGTAIQSLGNLNVETCSPTPCS